MVSRRPNGNFHPCVSFAPAKKLLSLGRDLCLAPRWGRTGPLLAPAGKPSRGGRGPGEGGLGNPARPSAEPRRLLAFDQMCTLEGQHEVQVHAGHSEPFKSTDTSSALLLWAPPLPLPVFRSTPLKCSPPGSSLTSSGNYLLPSPHFQSLCCFLYLCTFHITCVFILVFNFLFVSSFYPIEKLPKTKELPSESPTVNILPHLLHPSLYLCLYKGSGGI